jgi:hypothetical protein
MLEGYLIRLDKETKLRLDTWKKHPKEPWNDVVVRLLDIAGDPPVWNDAPDIVAGCETVTEPVKGTATGR